MIEPPAQNRVQWNCQECAFPIEDGYGAVTALYRFIHPGRTQEIPWHAWHYTCQPEDGYAIDVEQLRSATDAIRWTAHLFHKPWFYQTDWYHILREITTASNEPTKAVV